MKELKEAIEDKRGGVKGGYYIGKLIFFLSANGSLSFESVKNERWHGFCYTLVRETGITVTYHAPSKKGLAYNICWLSEILFRYLITDGLKEEQIRSMLV